MMKSLKVASVPPQVAEKPALPPKPAVNYKPLLPPRQNPDKDSSIDASPQPSSVSFFLTADFLQWEVERSLIYLCAFQDEKSVDYLLAKAELPLKPKPLTLKKHVIPPPPPPLPPPPPSQPPEFLGEMTKEETMDQEDERMLHDDSPSHPQIDQGDDRVAAYPDQSGESPMAAGHQQQQHPTTSNYDEDLGADQGAAALMTDTHDHSPPLEGVARRLRKGNLKSGTADALRKSRRVSFDPLALLLDASLEGELELVKKTALEVCFPKLQTR